ncbi:dTDP-4-dehydrorhamnose 3,5-epimerase [Saccharopolyspora gloriosae]|uniref:dTDP-4-dehydrorhamnose 3,5-epimerase n=1 Tax=Saccharopolyspora gloriosae TaxID=455344 RepID=UPI001FB81FB2|nr:dTDP-4-dehydrorhamnose 3,5-epimerase [Saccharopolyspora gloriosae]
MLIKTTPLGGSAVIELQLLEDDRGFFARAFARDDFAEAGLEPTIENCNISFNHRRGTLRGLHFQSEPHAEAKTIRCVRGAIYDVIVDLRPESPTYLRHFGTELSADNRLAMYVPENFAHGYLTLTDDTETMYQVSANHAPAAEGGLRWDDPALDIDWPVEVELVSAKDARWPLLSVESALDR